MKKIICLMLLIILVFSLLVASGCEKSERITITYYCPSSTAPSSDDAIIKYIEDKFNVNIVFTCTPWDDYEDSLKMRLESNQSPDVFSILDEKKTALMRSIISSGKAIDLNSVVTKEKYPYIYSYLDSNPDIQALYGEQNGKLYGIPPYYGELPQAILIRRDWLDKLNLKIPDTYDELKTTLIDFAKADLDKTSCSGVAIPDIWYVENIITAYTGINGFWAPVNGEWTFRVNYAGFKDALSYLHSLYTSGALDPEYGIDGEAESAQKFISGQVGATFFTPGINNYNNLVKGVSTNFPDSDCIFLAPFPSANNGSRAWVRNYGHYSATMVSSDVSPEKLNKILEIMDWSLSDDGKTICTYGLEGIHYTFNNSKSSRTPIEPAFSRDLPSNRSFATYFGLDVSTPQELLPEKYKDLLSAYQQYGVYDNVVLSIPTENNQLNQEMSDMEDAIYDVYYRYVQAFITGGKDIDKDWSDFINELNVAGLSQYKAQLEIYGTTIKNK